MNQSLTQLLEKWETCRILVLGDLILDRYTFGDARRVSPEAPVLVLATDAEEARPGGAAAVSLFSRSFGARTSVAGVLGQDADGQTLGRLLDEYRIDRDAVLCVPRRPTTCKERFVGRAAGRHAHQILRVDRETNRPLAPDLEDRLAEAVLRKLDEHQVLLVSDYAKGVCTPRLLATVLAATAGRDIPVIIDPAHITDYVRYRGADVLTPNRSEAETATGQTVCNRNEALAAGRALCRRVGVETVLVTLDSQGIVLAAADGPGRFFPTRARSVYDVTGAGDMVLAMVGLGMAAGSPLPEIVPLANLAAGLEVEKPGVAPVGRDEIQAELDRGPGPILAVLG